MTATVTTRDVFNNEYQANLSDLTQTIRVYAIIVKDDKLLLTKQWDGYSLPGGGVEKAESLEHALERELKEETGLDVTAGKIFYNTDRLFQRDATSKPVQAIMFFYDVASITGEISNQDITESEKTYTTGKAEWIPLAELKNITYRHSVDLQEILDHLPKNEQPTQQQEAFLARDMIQMIREYKDDANVLEYLEGFSASIARIVNNTDVVNWNDITGVCDQRYYSLKQGNPIALNTEMLDHCEHAISVYLPK